MFRLTADMIWRNPPVLYAGGNNKLSIRGGKNFHYSRNISYAIDLLPSTSINTHYALTPQCLQSRRRKGCALYCSKSSERNIFKEIMPSRSSQVELSTEFSSEGERLTINHDANSILQTQLKEPRRYRNRFLSFVRFGSLASDAAESFFKSEIRPRLFVTAVLIVASRIGYFIPLPGFDRRLIPKDCLTFVSGSVEELGDLTGNLKLSLFQLGISPHIAASILMQVLCHLIPSLVKLRKEGLDGHEKIKSYMWVSLIF